MQVHAHRIAVARLEPVVFDQPRRAAGQPQRVHVRCALVARNVDGASHGPLRGEDGRGRAMQEAIAFQIVLAGPHLQRAGVFDGGADGVGAPHRFAPGRAGAQLHPLRLGQKAVVAHRVQQHAVYVGQHHHAVAAANLAVHEVHHRAGERQHLGVLLQRLRQAQPARGLGQLAAAERRQACVQAALPGARQAVVQRAGQAGTVVQQVPACQLQAVGRNTHGCLSPDRPAEGRHGGCRVPVRTGVQARGRWAVPVYRSGAAYEMPLLGCDVPNCPGLSRPLFHKVTLPRGQAKPQGCQLQGKPAPLAQVCQAGTACVSVPAADPPWAAAYLPLRRQDHGHV